MTAKDPLAALDVASTTPPAPVPAVAAHVPGHWLTAWSFDPLVWGLAGFFLWLYARGQRARGERGPRLPAWREALFPAGVLLTWVTLESPLGALAYHLFWMRQLQHLVLHVLAPFLIFLARPQYALFAGMPRPLRHRLLLPLLKSRGARRFGRAATHPALAAALYIGTLAVWTVPALHNPTVTNPAMLALMLSTMFATGLLFFWVLFDPRDPPAGVGHGVRMAMLGAAGLSAIAVGAVLLLKTVEFYPAYDLTGRLWGWLPVDDEATGGFLIWLPSFTMIIAAMLTVLHEWNGSEVRRYMTQGRWTGSNSAALMQPETAEELWMMVAEKNRRLGIGLGVTAVTMFLLVLGMATSVHLLQ